MTRPPSPMDAVRLREAESALDLALEFRDLELAGGVDVLARRLEEARRIREKRQEPVQRMGVPRTTMPGAADVVRVAMGERDDEGDEP